MSTEYCSKCGTKLNENAVICIGCGCEIEENRKDYAAADLLALSVFLPVVGITLYGIHLYARPNAAKAYRSCAIVGILLYLLLMLLSLK